MPNKIRCNKKVIEKIDNSIKEYPAVKDQINNILELLFKKPKFGYKFYPEEFENVDIPINDDDDFRYFWVGPFGLFYSINKDDMIDILDFEKCRYSCCD